MGRHARRAARGPFDYRIATTGGLMQQESNGGGFYGGDDAPGRPTSRVLRPLGGMASC